MISPSPALEHLAGSLAIGGDTPAGFHENGAPHIIGGMNIDKKQMKKIANALRGIEHDRPSLLGALAEEDRKAMSETGALLAAAADVDAYAPVADPDVLAQAAIVYARMRATGTDEDTCADCAVKTACLINRSDLADGNTPEARIVRILVGHASDEGHERVFPDRAGMTSKHTSHDKVLSGWHIRRSITARRTYDELCWSTKDPVHVLMLFGFEPAAELMLLIGNTSTLTRRYCTSRKRLFESAVKCAESSKEAFYLFLRLLRMMLAKTLHQPMPSAEAIISNCEEGLPDDFFLENLSFESGLDDNDVRTAIAGFREFLDSRHWDDERTADTLWGMVAAESFQYNANGTIDSYRVDRTVDGCAAKVVEFAQNRRRQALRIIGMLQALPENVTSLMPETYCPYSPQCSGYTTEHCRNTYMDILEMTLKQGKDGIIRWKTLLALKPIISGAAHGEEFTRLKADSENGGQRRYVVSRFGSEERKYLRKGRMMANISVYDHSYSLKALLGDDALERIASLQDIIGKRNIVVNSDHDSDIMDAWKNTLNR